MAPTAFSWLAGEYRPRSLRPAQVEQRPVRVVRTPPVDERPVEDIVIDHLISHLKAAGWSIVAKRSAANREHGVDIEARFGERRLLVEAKGWPAAAYVRGARAGEPKDYLPYTQARAYFSNALLPVLLLWSEQRSEVALAFPDKITYRTLLDRSAPAVRMLDIGAYLVDMDTGAVHARLDHQPAGAR